MRSNGDVYSSGLIFLTTTDSTTPHGRNVRVRQRVQHAAPAREQYGSFVTFDCQSGIVRRRKPKGRPGRSLQRQQDENTLPVVRQAIHQYQTLYRPLSIYPGGKTYIDIDNIKPLELLLLASLHIRRLASITLRSQTSSMLDTLRCRQWSFATLNAYTPRKISYLDGAILCVAAKLRQITFDNISPFLVLSLYDRALRSVHEALQEAGLQRNSTKLLAAIQLLAIYEMLDGPGNDVWPRHVQGAHAVIKTHLASGDTSPRFPDVVAGQVVPFLIDALLSDDRSFLEQFPWRDWLQTAMTERSRAHRSEPIFSCFLELPGILVEAGSASNTTNMTYRLGVLYRAQDVKSRIRALLLDTDDLALDLGDKSMPLDILGLGLSAMITLERVIASLLPKGSRMLVLPAEMTDELCIRVLESELESPAAHSAMEAMFATQRQSCGLG